MALYKFRVIIVVIIIMQLVLDQPWTGSTD